MATQYYIGSAKVEDDELVEIYISPEYLKIAAKTMKEAGELPEHLRDETTGDFRWTQWKLLRKKMTTTDGYTHDVLLSAPWDKQAQSAVDTSFGASGAGTPTEKQQEDAKKRIEAEQDNIDLKDVPF